ncbi:MAG: zinc ribbon domain-containing protein [Candidatus Heimdallarchaeota archaeon]|nr:zinc ribbon domain-containing protein [Candidatus Heimdallarchaeota archaeon]
MKVCPACNTEILEDTARFCTECGLELESKFITVERPITQKSNITRVNPPSMNEERIIQLAEDLINKSGAALSSRDLSRMTNNPESTVRDVLSLLSATNRWQSSNIDDLTYFWSPLYKMAIRDNMIGPFHGFSIDIKKKTAIRLLDKYFRIRNQKMGKIRKIEIRNLPLWEIQTNELEIEKRHYFINGLNGGILDIQDPHFDFPFSSHDERIQTQQLTLFDSDTILKRQMRLEKLSKSCIFPNLNREHAIYVFNTKIKAFRTDIQLDPKTFPTLIYFPIYEIQVQSMILWMDGIWGMIAKSNPFDET